MRLAQVVASVVLVGLPLGGCAQVTDAPVWLEVTSPDFADGEHLDAAHTCDGGDTAPDLAWGPPPDGTAEVAVLLDDPDAGGFGHWVVSGLPSDATRLDGEAPPATAVVGRNDFGSRGYRGPCPPAGDGAHRYVVTVWALDEPLALGPDADAAALRAAVEGRVVARGELVGRYARR